MLTQALYVMAAWGFEYRTHMIWEKDRTGTGHWVRNKHELLLIGTRGYVPVPAHGAQSVSVIHARRCDALLCHDAVGRCRVAAKPLRVGRSSKPSRRNRTVTCPCPSWRRVWPASSLFLGGRRGRQVTHVARKEIALARQYQEVIPRLRGGRVGRQPAPTLRETLLLRL
jgi:hypothetical protein